MKRAYAIFLLLLLPFLVGWKTYDPIESSMRDIGFRLKKRELLKIPYSNRVETRYVFTHRLHSVTIIRDYNNGFVEIRSHYRSKGGESSKWDLSIMRTVEKGNFRNTVYRIFVLGDTR